jgi:hypothetical protein
MRPKNGKPASIGAWIVGLWGNTRLVKDLRPVAWWLERAGRVRVQKYHVAPRLGTRRVQRRILERICTEMWSLE